jgi:hypothetical protein
MASKIMSMCQQLSVTFTCTKGKKRGVAYSLLKFASLQKVTSVLDSQIEKNANTQFQHKQIIANAIVYTARDLNKIKPHRNGKPQYSVDKVIKISYTRIRSCIAITTVCLALLRNIHKPVNLIEHYET